MQYITPLFIAGSVLTLLSLLLGWACWTDIKSRRIPNKLILVGSLSGLTLNLLLPEGSGFASGLPGAIGLPAAAGGFGMGLALLLPLYFLRGMGAGDVKLVAMIGTFVGSDAIIKIILLIFLVGGFFSIALALRQKTMGMLAINLKYIMHSAIHKSLMNEMPKLDTPYISAGKLPYAVPISVGTFIYIFLGLRSSDFLFFMGFL